MGKNFNEKTATEPRMTPSDINRFDHGICYDVYEKMGAHLGVDARGTEGCWFTVWAPNAKAVCVVGEFNGWKNWANTMERISSSGIFECFVPGVKENMLYKYAVSSWKDEIVLKSDPYAFSNELRPNTASRVYSIDNFKWTDEKWMEHKKIKDYKTEPMSIYELHLGSWRKPKIEGVSENESFYNYRELAPMLAEYVHKMGYTHIELLPVMEHPFDASWGYQVTGYYAPTSRCGTPDDFMYFMNYMHKENIGVILDWVPAHFPRDAFGLARFDGDCVYENKDPRRGSHPHWGTLIFDYGRPQVSNFLIANALFWAEVYHADGIRMDAVASMLYLDYGREDGEWLPNIYGGNENLEAIEFFKHLNSVFKKREKGTLLIAEESTAWPKITAAVKDDGLGFDLKWNMGWMNDFLDYMRTDPLFRKGKHGELTFSMVYAYSENFLLVLSHDEVVHGKGSMIGKMPGNYEEKFANLRAAYGFMMTHPGKKLLFMGQDFAQFSEWNEAKELEWFMVDEYEPHRKMQEYVKALNNLYQDYPALYEKDFDPEGFEWISCLDGDHSTVAFLRKTDKPSEDLLIVCNFTPVTREKFRVGVPHPGSYKEIFNSDRVEFGGAGNVNPRMKSAGEKEHDGRDYSIEITLPGLSVCVFSCQYKKEEKKKEKRKEKRK